MVSLSYFLCAVIYVLTIYLSSHLFTPYSVQSFTLNAFSSADPLALLAFCSYGISILASFPLIFFSLRNSALLLSENSGCKGINNIPMMTTILLFIIGTLGVICKDIGKVGAVGGAVLGTSMMFIFPSIMYLNLLWKQRQRHLIFFHKLKEGKDKMGEYEDVSLSNQFQTKMLVNGALLSCGIGIGLMGTINSIKSLFI
jgi:hypothetical protein